MSEASTAESAVDQARAKANEAGAQAKEKAQETKSQARDRVRSEVDRRSTEAGVQAGSTAHALRRASDQLRQDGNEPIARGMEQVAERVERTGSWLREADGDRILREAEDFGRRNPLAVVAGGVALGFVASRLLKASSRNRYEQSSAGTSHAGNGHARNPVPATEGLAPTGVTTPGVPPTGVAPTDVTAPGVPPTGVAPRGVTAPAPGTTGWREGEPSRGT
jgi:hypothetical protein